MKKENNIFRRNGRILRRSDEGFFEEGGASKKGGSSKKEMEFFVLRVRRSKTPHLRFSDPKIE